VALNSEVVFLSESRVAPADYGREKPLRQSETSFNKWLEDGNQNDKQARDDKPGKRFADEELRTRRNLTPLPSPGRYIAAIADRAVGRREHLHVEQPIPWPKGIDRPLMVGLIMVCWSQKRGICGASSLESVEWIIGRPN
jgi:hypothetical protein